MDPFTLADCSERMSSALEARHPGWNCQAMSTDIVYENGRVYDSVLGESRPGELVTRGDRILAIEQPGATRLLHPSAERVDLAGGTLYPGFIDSHAHFIDTGMMLARLDFGSATTVQDVLDRIRAVAMQASEGWIHGGNLDENFLAEKRLPSVAELDEASSGRPLYINHRSYHWTLVNSSAFELIDLPALPGIDRDPAGRPTGLLDIDANAEAKVRVAALTPLAEIDAGIRAAATLASQLGITTVHCIEGGEEYGGVRFADRLLACDDLPFDPIVYICTGDVAQAVERGLPRVGGDITVDGSISNRTAAFHEHYADRPDTDGHLYYSSTELEDMIDGAHSAGIQIGFHAIGDRGVDAILKAYRRILDRYPSSDHRHRIEHFGLPLPHHVEEAAALGLTIVVQPAFMAQKLPTYRTRLGSRAESLYPLRTLLDAGINVAGSSDTLVSPFNPLIGIDAAVNGPVAGERLSVGEAIMLYTTAGARACFRDNETGSLQPGLLADLTLLDRDLQHIPTNEISAASVMRTVFRGTTVFERTQR